MCCCGCLAGIFSCACCACKLIWKIVSFIATIIVILVIVLLIVFLVKPAKDEGDGTGTTTTTISPKINARMLRYEPFRKAAVTANGFECAAIGRDILERNGSAADAAIATMFCDGVACTQCMGLGGGFLLTVYTRATGKVEVLNSREVAPALSHKDMFQNGTISTTVGGKAVAVPGELRGYQELHRKYGKLPWADLVKPSIELCYKGHYVTEYLARILKERKEKIQAEPSLSEIFINPETNDVWIKGDKIKRLKLAKTLEIISKEGADALYDGSLTKSFVEDVKSFDGILTEEDMKNYRPQWLEPLSVSLGEDHQLHTVPLPGSGHILSFILNTLRGWVVPKNIDEKEKMDVTENSVTYWHRIVEVFKYAYAKRTGLGDPRFMSESYLKPLLKNLTSMEHAKYIRSLIEDDKTYNNWTHYGADFGLVEDHGTAHISVMAPNGDAISVTSTINFILGALRRSMSTGIILNNEMDDFSFPNIENVYGIPPSPNNFVEPGKTPLSSMVPSVVVQKGRGARMLIGAAGGTKITTQVALIIMKNLLSNKPLQEAIHEPRAHHQLFPMEVQCEHDFDNNIIKGLESIGHKISKSEPNVGFAAVTAITMNRETGEIDASFDERRSGSYAGF